MLLWFWCPKDINFLKLSNRLQDAMKIANVLIGEESVLYQLNYRIYLKWWRTCFWLLARRQEKYCNEDFSVKMTDIGVQKFQCLILIQIIFSWKCDCMKSVYGFCIAKRKWQTLHVSHSFLFSRTHQFD